MCNLHKIALAVFCIFFTNLQMRGTFLLRNPIKNAIICTRTNSLLRVLYSAGSFLSRKRKVLLALHAG